MGNEKWQRGDKRKGVNRERGLGTMSDSVSERGWRGEEEEG